MAASAWSKSKELHTLLAKLGVSPQPELTAVASTTVPSSPSPAPAPVSSVSTSYADLVRGKATCSTKTQSPLQSPPSSPNHKNLNQNQNKSLPPQELKGKGKGKTKNGKKNKRRYPKKSKNRSSRSSFHVDRQYAEMREYLNLCAVAQIEYYFTPDNLSRDVFLRSHMDVNGCVPITFVCSFPAVVQLGVDYNTLKNLLVASKSVYMDLGNELIRPLHNPTQWLLPTGPNGQMGLETYAKPGIQTSSEKRDSVASVVPSLANSSDSSSDSSST